MAAEARARAASAASSWLVPAPPPDGRPLLVCCPYAGGGAAVFASWQALLPELAVVAVRLPGRESRFCEPALRDLREAVGAVAAALEPHLDRDVALFGHSMGGWLAFEIARRLERERGVSPKLLAVSACVSPVGTRAPALHRVADDEQLLAALRDRLGTPDAALDHAELAELMLPTIRADLEAVERHRFVPSEPLSCPVLSLYGTEDRAYDRDHVAGWCAQTSGPSRLAAVSGGHFFLHAERARVAGLIRDALEEA